MGSPQEIESVLSTMRNGLYGYHGLSNTSSVRHKIRLTVKSAVDLISDLIGQNVGIPKVYVLNRKVASGFIIVLSTWPEFVERWKSLGFVVFSESEAICSRCRGQMVGIRDGLECLNCWPQDISEEVLAILQE